MKVVLMVKRVPLCKMSLPLWLATRPRCTLTNCNVSRSLIGICHSMRAQLPLISAALKKFDASGTESCRQRTLLQPDSS